MTQEKRHDEHCKAIVEELEKLTDGGYCLIDGELAEIKTDDYACDYAEVDGTYYADGISSVSLGGEEIPTEDAALDEATLIDWLGDSMYNIDWVLDYNKEYEACRIMIACGGPNIYINTWDKCVELYWWTESGKAWLPSEVCDYIDDYMKELFYL